MKITKTFRTETSHIVRNCTSERCSYSIHGHSYLIEVELESRRLDNAQMVLDFGLLKGAVKEYIDSLDHCHLICEKDDFEYVESMKSLSQRWISLPFNPSAEMMAVWLLGAVNLILNKTEYANREDIKNLKCTSVTVWETTTGRATADLRDLEHMYKLIDFDNIEYSKGVWKDWSLDLLKIIKNEDHYITNPEPANQIDNLYKY
nr:MAG TPA: 6-pyruvoyl tetrahydropterin synthase [Caudoviricetes sp.]